MPDTANLRKDLVTPALDSAELRKARGAFYTPQVVCDYLAAWAIRSATDRVLEPSCGEAAFLTAAVSRLRSLGVAKPSIDGVEIHRTSAATARKVVQELGATVRIRVDDFLATPATKRFDVVIGNPPYVRYQGLTGEARARALRAAMAQGVMLPQLTNSWAPFVVHAASQLSSQGRLALIVPAELLTAKFASEVRRFLLHRFASVRIVLSDEALFPGVLTDALLLLAEGSGGTDHIELVQVRNAEELAEQRDAIRWKPPAIPGSRWVSSLVDEVSIVAMEEFTEMGLLSPLAEWGRIALGAVTGSNDFFALSREQIADLGLQDCDLTKISPPGSKHLRAITFTKRQYETLGAENKRVLLFRPAGEPSPAGRKYIRRGESQQVDGAYKCRVREPWWRVPIGRVPDLLLTYMNGDTPRLSANLAGVHYLNSVHGLYLTEANSDLAVCLAVSSVNSATLLGAELVGRAYGGGILKLEPGEAIHLPLPNPTTVRRHAKRLRALLPALQKLPLCEAVLLVDEIVFRDVDPEQLDAVRRSRAALYQRRLTRGASHHR